MSPYFRLHCPEQLESAKQSQISQVVLLMMSSLLVLSAICCVAPCGDNEELLVLKPARVFDGTSDIAQPGWVVVVRGNRIERVGPAREVPNVAGARIVDLPGQTLLPGLIDAHSHVLLHPYNEALWDDIRTVVAPPQHPSIFRAAVAHLRQEQQRGLIAYRERSVDIAELLDDAIQASRKAIQNGAPLATQPRADDQALIFDEQELMRMDEVLIRYESVLVQRLHALVAGQEKAAISLATAADEYRAAYARHAHSS